MSKEEYLKVSTNDIFNNYQVVKAIGKGAFSQVFKVNELNIKNSFALKIGRISNRFQKSYQNEIKILKILNTKNNENIIRMIESFKFNDRYFLVFEIYGNNLFNFFSKFNHNGLDLTIIKSFINQIINGLKLLKSLNIIHGDLKPENILISDCGKNLKIIDFGSSFYEKKGKYLNYIQTRYYRSPDVLLGLEITCSIDLWSFGCIVYEMLRGYPLFKAKNYQDLFLYHTHLLGIPNISLIEKSQYGNEYFYKKGKNYTLKKNYDSKNFFFDPNTRDIDRHKNKENQLIFDVIKKCLQWDPSSRLNIQKFKNV
jgi:dual specificity tyrosine-phosphorylation-regulated kinase 2/3/4